MMEDPKNIKEELTEDELKGAMVAMVQLPFLITHLAVLRKS